jgi:tellurite resistance protein
MSALDAIGIEARQVLLEVMMSVAWADRELAPEERQAANAAAVSLGLVMPGDRDLVSAERRPLAVEEIDVSGLKPRDRELVFLCAAWMAMADNFEQSEETELLGRIRLKLGVELERAEWLRVRAVELRKKQELERSSWWRAFDRLVVEAARALPH